MENKLSILVWASGMITPPIALFALGWLYSKDLAYASLLGGLGLVIAGLYTKYLVDTALGEYDINND